MIVYISRKSRCSSAGRALPWGGRGRRFKSCHLDQSDVQTGVRFFFIYQYFKGILELSPKCPLFFPVTQFSSGCYTICYADLCNAFVFCGLYMLTNSKACFLILYYHSANVAKTTSFSLSQTTLSLITVSYNLLCYLLDEPYVCQTTRYSFPQNTPCFHILFQSNLKKYNTVPLFEKEHT